MSRRPPLSPRKLLVTLCVAGSFLALGELAAQEQNLWRFKYFAGDPPTWKDEAQLWGNKAECEIARAEKTAAGYPVGDCYALPAVTPPNRQVTSTTTTTTTTSGKATAGKSPPVPAQPTSTADLERMRQEKLRQGCLVQCNTTQRACAAVMPELDTCIQNHNSECIERCTRVEQLPHHQCINEVCLPTDVNIASWQGLCETERQRVQSACAQAHTTCTRSCT